MRSKISESVARSKEPLQRPRLLSHWALFGIALMVLAPLALIYPKQTLIQEAARQRLGDPLTANYLANLLKTDPDNLELRLLLAEQNLRLGELDEISQLLAPVGALGATGQRRAAWLLELKVIAIQVAGLPAGSPQRADMVRRQRDILAELAGSVLPSDTLVDLADAAIAADAPATARQFYRQLARLDVPQSARWFAQAARGALGQGYYELAAELYFIARHKATNPDERRDHLIAGLKALLAESRFAQAMQAADRELGALADDPETLYALAGMARSANDLPRADHYVRSLLQLSFFEHTWRWLARPGSGPAAAEPPRGMRPYDARHYQLAWEIFLANRNLKDAFKVAEAAVRQTPGDPVWRERLAQVAEWDGKPEIALQQWLQLARRGGGEAWQAVLRLAPGLNDHPATLEAWRHVAAQRRLAPTEWQRIADLYEFAAQPVEGADFLVSRYPHERNPLLLELAARLQHNGGRDDDALKTWLRLIEHHGATTDRVLKAATLHLQRGNFREAAALLQRHRALAGTANAEYWRLLGGLAWRLQKDDEARDAYRRLAAGPDATREDLSRLATLLRREHPEEAAALAELAWRKFGEAEMLLWALELHAEQRNLAAQRRLFDSIG
ncbi:MAG: tetratricopeptide repeat protein, partial [Gallionella sp.]